MNGDKEFINENGGEPVSEALGNLHRVSAPVGFEQDVRRRIRAHDGEPAKSRFLWLKVAIPTAALALLAAFFGISSISTDIPNITVAEQTPANVKEENLIGVSAAEPKNDQAMMDDRSSNADKALAVNPKPVRAANERPGTKPASEDFTAGAPSTPTMPKGFDPNTKPSGSMPVFDRPLTVKLTELVNIVGITATISNGVFVATSVNENSPAKRAGVKVGDVLESVNDIALSRTATVSGRFEVSSIGVRRNGVSLKLKL